MMLQLVFHLAIFTAGVAGVRGRAFLRSFYSQSHLRPAAARLDVDPSCTASSVKHFPCVSLDRSRGCRPIATATNWRPGRETPNGPQNFKI